MMTTVPDFIALLKLHGSVVLYHRDDSTLPCPCLTKEGARNPEWHLDLEAQLANAVTTAGVPDTGAPTLDDTQGYSWFIYAISDLGAILGPEILIGDVPANTVGSPYSMNFEITVPSISGVAGVAVARSVNNGPKQFIGPLYATGTFVDSTPANVLNPLGDIPARCNPAGMLPDPTNPGEFTVKGFVQPVQSGAVRRLTSEQLQTMFGEIESDDHIGFFPVEWEGKLLNFYDWGQSTEDFIEYNNRRYTVVSVNLIPDPADGNPWHHWEVGLRLIRA